MSQKHGDRVAPPATGLAWEIRFGSNDAAKGWHELCQQAPGNTAQVWWELRDRPAPTAVSPRHHPLKGALAFATRDGARLSQWQIEVTGGGRIWYLLDSERHTVSIVFAGNGHPSRTDH